MLEFAVVDMSKAKLQLDWILTMVFSVLTLLSLLFLSYLCCRSGPYVKGTYEHKSIGNTFWQHRKIKPELFEDMIQYALQPDLDDKSISEREYSVDQFNMNDAAPTQNIPIQIKLPVHQTPDKSQQQGREASAFKDQQLDKSA